MLHSDTHIKPIYDDKIITNKKSINFLSIDGLPSFMCIIVQLTIASNTPIM
jgi:hypothetical protein